MFFIYLCIIILFILLYFNCNNYKENLNFTRPYLLDKYKKSNIKIDKNKKTLQKDNISISYKNQFNTLKSNKICNNKYKTSKLLKKNNIPVPNFVLWKEKKIIIII